MKNNLLNFLINEEYLHDAYEKVAFNVEVNPAPLLGSLAGAVSGGSIAKRQVHKKFEQEMKRRDNLVSLDGNYYNQAKNIAENLKVIFTPVSVIYLVKDGVKETTIETINIEEMTKDMKMNWKMKNYDYFKNLLLNRMMSEIQFSEQQFAKNMIQNHLTKHASADTRTSNPLDFLVDVAELSATLNNDEMFKSASYEDMDEVCDVPPYTFTLELERPLEKYSSVFTKPLEVLGILNNTRGIDGMQQGYLKPSYLSKKVNVGFMPDRVVFTVDNKLITTLKSIDMNAEAFERFQESDKHYFLDLFSKYTKKGLKEMSKKASDEGAVQTESEPLYRIDTAHVFKSSSVHPLVYLHVLTNAFGPEWINADANALVKMIELQFGLKAPISGVAMNKILSIKMLNLSTIPFSKPIAFEKAIRSFCDMPIDWETFERDDIAPEDLVFGIDAIDMVTPQIDIYGLFSEEVLKYITDIFVANDFKICRPTVLMNTSHNHGIFYRAINAWVLDENIREDSYNVFNDDKLKEIHDMNKNIVAYAMGILNDPDETSVDEKLNKYMVPEDIRPMVGTQVTNAIFIDKYLTSKMKLLKAHMSLYNVITSGGEQVDG